MSTLQAKSFQNRATFYKHLGTMTDNFDVEKSLGQPYFCYTDASGKQHNFKILSHFLGSLNQVCGTEFVLSKCFSRRNSFIVQWSDKGVVVKESTVEEVVVEETPVEDAPVEEPAVEETTVSEALTSDEENEAGSPSLEEAKALYTPSDKAGSKVKLDDYAKGFDIDLNRSKSFDNMIKELAQKIK